MKRFCQLFQSIDATTSTTAKVRALTTYFEQEDPANQVWALYLLLGKTRRRVVTSRILRSVFLQVSDLPEWLFQDCYAQVGDSAEVIALLLNDLPLPPANQPDRSLHEWMEEIIPQAKTAPTEADLAALVVSWWSALDQTEILVLNKILTGAFRIGASEKLVVKGLSAATQVPVPVLTHRLMGEFIPTVSTYQRLISQDASQNPPSQPYPFFLAAPLEVAKFQSEDLTQWRAEWKWDGIRAQAIQRSDQVFIWSRGEELITSQFPELETALSVFPNGTVLDGEILCWQHDRPLSFNHLQKRLGRKRVTKKVMAESPVHFIAYDLLEMAGVDLRQQSLQQRQAHLGDLLRAASQPIIQGSESLPFATLEDLQQLRQHSRQRGAEGLMLKRLDSPYLVGRKRGYWWKYKVDPMSLDAVLIYAQAGSGKRANLFTDYTFALWQGDQLVPFAKAYSGLDNAEIEALDRWIRRHTLERFGPVRSVQPTQVFEIGFEGIAVSNRHKSGISVRFPRILRWRSDKPGEEADTLQQAHDLLANVGTGQP